MLSDSGGRIGSAYGVYDEEAGVNIRGRFLIDPDGVIQAMETVAPPVGRNVPELIR
jgi:peroxiredoxin (alkyl hydroperoxide reductase subunit C)